MNIQGLNRFIRTLNNATNNFDEEASKRLNNISQKLVAKVKLKTPVSTGILRKNWRIKSEGDLAKIVYNNTHYALMWGI
ncbi:MAG: HK97 gp10 family phage protein [Peptostreptococcaceae bacterium]|nr:HK97 gp10 family phage protein [Peptostreptococcaceae bacterium]